MPFVFLFNTSVMCARNLCLPSTSPFVVVKYLSKYRFPVRHMGDSPVQICAPSPADDSSATQKPVINSPSIPGLEWMCRLDQQGAAKYREHTTAEEEWRKPGLHTKATGSFEPSSGGNLNQVTRVHH